MIKKDKMDNTKEYRRRSIRLKGYDYSQNGAYFVTICTYHGQCIFGNVIDGIMRVNKYGRVVLEEWSRSEKLRGNIYMDYFVVMPNHLHGIIVINDRRGVLQYAPTKTKFQSPSKTVGAIVRGFKSITTKQINRTRKTFGLPVWQRNYYEHVIRNEDDLKQIREYIVNNPGKWELDSENPEKIKQQKRIYEY